MPAHESPPGKHKKKAGCGARGRRPGEGGNLEEVNEDESEELVLLAGKPRADLLPAVVLPTTEASLERGAGKRFFQTHIRPLKSLGGVDVSGSTRSNGGVRHCHVKVTLMTKL